MENSYPLDSLRGSLRALGIHDTDHLLPKLIDLLAKHLYLNGRRHNLTIRHDGSWTAYYQHINGEILHLETGQSLVDAVARLIIYCIETGFIEKRPPQAEPRHIGETEQYIQSSRNARQSDQGIIIENKDESLEEK